MSDSLDFMLRLALFSIIHSVLAAPRFKEWLQSLVKGGLPGYRLFYNLLSFLLFAWVMLAWKSTKVLFVFPGIWSLVLYGLQFLVLWLGFICVGQTGLSAFSGINFSQENVKPQLVTTGCYAMVRHPLYLLGTLFLILNPVITTRWLALTLFSVLYFMAGALLEERRMIKQYGDVYRTYQQDVPFIFPRLNRHPKVEKINVS